MEKQNQLLEKFRILVHEAKELGINSEQLIALCKEKEETK